MEGVNGSIPFSSTFTPDRAQSAPAGRNLSAKPRAVPRTRATAAPARTPLGGGDSLNFRLLHDRLLGQQANHHQREESQGNRHDGRLAEFRDR
jgi:hypothetical protein